MQKIWWWVAALVALVLVFWGLVFAANQWLMPALDCMANGGEACSSAALVGVVVLAALATLYGLWRLLRHLLGQPR